MSDIQSTGKHGPLHDDALKHDTEGMVRAGRSTRGEDRDPEPAGEDQPGVTLSPDATLARGTPEGMSEADVDGRSELARFLGRVYPADRDRLLDAARANNATDAVIGRLRGLPAGQEFTNVQQVWAVLGGGTEEHRS